MTALEAFQAFVTAVGMATAIGPAVQAYRIWTVKSARAVSLFNFASIGAGCVIWLAWGIVSANLPLVVANAAATLTYSAAVASILRFRACTTTSRVLGSFPVAQTQVQIQDQGDSSQSG